MPTYTITELAHEFDITSRTIRFYEDQGLITPKREGAGGRIRVYSARERTRLKLTLRGKRLGFTLSEIKSLVDMYDSTQDSSAQLKGFLLVLAQHRETLEQQREDLEITLAEIAAHEAECRRMLAAGKGNKDSKSGKDGKSAKNIKSDKNDKRTKSAGADKGAVAGIAVPAAPKTPVRKAASRRPKPAAAAS